MAMKKVTVAMTEEMYNGLEEERKTPRLSSVAGKLDLSWENIYDLYKRQKYRN
jgi:hypothetical protein